MNELYPFYCSGNWDSERSSDLPKASLPKMDSNFWLFPLQVGSDIVFYRVCVVLSPESVFDSLKKDTGKMQMDGHPIRGVEESLAYSSVQIFLKFLTLPEIYILKNMTIWIPSLLKIKTQGHAEKNDCVGFLIFLGGVGIKLHSSQEKLIPEFACGAERFAPALSLEVPGRVMRGPHFGRGPGVLGSPVVWPTGVVTSCSHCWRKCHPDQLRYQSNKKRSPCSTKPERQNVGCEVSPRRKLQWQFWLLHWTDTLSLFSTRFHCPRGGLTQPVFSLMVLVPCLERPFSSEDYNDLLLHLLMKLLSF